VLAILVILAEASTRFSDSLVYTTRVGPLSGEVIWAVVAFFGSWAILTLLLRGRQVSLARIAVVSATMIGLALVGTFSPFFQLFGQS
jgi:hypothetical protein